MLAELFLNFCKVTIIIGGLLTVTSRNPVYSVLFLVYTFLNVAIILLFLQVEYFSILLILVYLGAIAVLFLFVVMLLNIRIFEVTQQTIAFVPFLLFFVFLSFFFFSIF